ncbi:hypothetical protein PR202_gb02711 [Eleusine coracana subsp. coracana]|uniref:Uncharacterized protein n=1 Tax=Eleusine coracana subsp. coracana TaxID=191504 RepID=A0AAV5DZ75_ELECO|nr:hypothetical protein QOZ80_8BG0665380 [Eleusine coracana subsp. coracana]GJN15772.1 hypothetical protein PR202_gb02711 [Eleusine coracana subsp. coracana]
MKASIKFRDDDRPLMRAKVPIGVLGLPFQSGLSAGGDPRELRFDLSTAFASGPSLRLSYLPNDAGLPFALTVRAGLGPLGSPARAPFALAAEFNLLSSDPSSPAFFLRLKPRLGDFSLAHTLRSSSSSSSAGPASSPTPRKIGEVSGGNGHQHEAGYNYKAFSFSGNGLAADVAAAGRSGGGLGALLSGMRLTTRSVLPLWGRASLRFNWGLRVPPELQPGALADAKGARAPVSKMPLLVMSKVCIEQSPRADGDKRCGMADASIAGVSNGSSGYGGGGSDDEVVAFSLVKRQLEAMNVENVMLRRAVEDLRAEVRCRRDAASPAASVVEARRAASPPQPQPYHSFQAKQDRRGSGKEREPAAGKVGKAAVAVAADDVSEQLKKALEARRR